MYRRNLLIAVDGAGASHGLVDHITTLNASPWRTVGYSIGWELGARERAAINRVPASAWGTVLNPQGQPRELEETGVVEVTALLRQGPHGDQLVTWPADLRIICRREKPHPGAQLSLFEETDGWRYQLLATNTPGKTAQFLEARHLPHARVKDTIRTHGAAQIATRLHISVRTVETHLARSYPKLGVTCKQQLYITPRSSAVPVGSIVSTYPAVRTRR